MTLEYMIYKLNDAVAMGDDDTVGRMVKQVWPQLEAHLRAGQTMRGKFTIRYDSGDESHVATKVDYLGLGEAGQAWGAAVTAGNLGEKE